MAKAAKTKPPPLPPADPMPRRVEPCVATLVDKPPKGPEWAFEVKWDGYRLAIHVEPGEVRAITRGGYDWTKKFGPIVAEARELGHASMIVDGEAVVLDDQGRSDFGLLQRALGKKPSSHDTSEILFYAFDLLYLDGHDLRALPLSERRRLLEPIVAGRTGAIRFSQEVPADGAEFFQVACEMGLEGIIAKRRDAPYRIGRRPEWLKIKCVRRDTFVIVGFEPSTVPGAIGRLLLAAKDAKGLTYVGGVGTGWTYEMSVELRKFLQERVTLTPAVKLSRKGAVFTEPVLVADIEYRAWTEDKKLRHPSFKGVKKRTSKAQVYEIKRPPE
ncbi:MULTISPECIES: non-homologous end-joining DNA ligase [unclassified Ensifer]|uniref:non-homologous end-joining DNA ligase n=1 Tax=unclassified Ensifer TaxID=2633371 RepID=UPI0008135C0E|nr:MULTISPECIES: non-homologous end-joining DNA ligase [unclassified Ensifer]OCP04984.1 ATP-dependent DNA ligase [Ensifer sp. LC14]OCP11857.1 ATP-dependent DNA ligase [Ensifer sp. LC13]OCP12414.1 ATP-dependent DNA ligase [Ensifer sp. LC11]OCP33619.1 ATP-dependent DNA ligase [Ensifer sp. LC499]